MKHFFFVVVAFQHGHNNPPIALGNKRNRSPSTTQCQVLHPAVCHHVPQHWFVSPTITALRSLLASHKHHPAPSAAALRSNAIRQGADRGGGGGVVFSNAHCWIGSEWSEARSTLWRLYFLVGHKGLNTDLLSAARVQIQQHVNSPPCRVLAGLALPSAGSFVVLHPLSIFIIIFCCIFCSRLVELLI